jgi:predicted dehydrogenase
VLVRFDNGMKGCVTVGQVCAGHKNDLWFEVNGATASLRWFQERQNELWIGRRHAANQVLLKDPALVGPEARRYAHLPPGHQEAWSDAFRNVIADVYARITGRSDQPPFGEGELRRSAGALAKAERTSPTPDERPSFPTFEDGYRAACLVDAILDSHRRGGVWTTVDTRPEITA